MAQLQEWFEAHWNEATDITETIIETVSRHIHLYSPFDVYAKALQEFFRGHDFEPGAVLERARAFRDSDLDDVGTCRALGIPIKKGWNIKRARERINQLDNLSDRVKTLLYRPFDKRAIFYHNSLVWGMAWPVMQHMLSGRNLALITSRMTKGETFCHALVSDTFSEVILLSSRTSNNAFVFPLYLRSERTGFCLEPRANFSPGFLTSLAERLDLARNGWDGAAEQALAENTFYYIYAVLWSGTYRARYAEFLKIDFPRLPLPGTSGLFYTLVRLGRGLVALHLMESPKLEKIISSYAGPAHPTIGRIGWSNDTVWIDAVRPKKGAADIDVTGTVGFRGVPEEVWNFHIGGYQVCEKWLKDRKGRTLTAEDITHYHRIVIALHETIRIMREIDEVIDAHGGWPGAFASGRVPEAAGG